MWCFIQYIKSDLFFAQSLSSTLNLKRRSFQRYIVIFQLSQSDTNIFLSKNVLININFENKIKKMITDKLIVLKQLDVFHLNIFFYVYNNYVYKYFIICCHSLLHENKILKHLVKLSFI